MLTYNAMASSDDDQPFVTILNAMGIEEFDPLVPVALNEYAARKNYLFVWTSASAVIVIDAVPLSGFASEILQDAKDYSVHAGRLVKTFSSVTAISIGEIYGLLRL